MDGGPRWGAPRPRGALRLPRHAAPAMPRRAAPPALPAPAQLPPSRARCMEGRQGARGAQGSLSVCRGPAAAAWAGRGGGGGSRPTSERRHEACMRGTERGRRAPRDAVVAGTVGGLAPGVAMLPVVAAAAAGRGRTRAARKGAEKSKGRWLELGSHGSSRDSSWKHAGPGRPAGRQAEQQAHSSSTSAVQHAPSAEASERGVDGMRSRAGLTAAR